MTHHAGVDLILGTDFMIPAGVRLDLYNSSVKLPDEMVIPLIRSSNTPTKTDAVRTKQEVSATEDSAITEGDPEECSEQVISDEQPVTEDQAKFGVIRPSIVDEVNSAMSALNTRSAGINHVVTANSALEDPAIRNDLEADSACHKAVHYAREEYGRVEVCSAVTADSAFCRRGELSDGYARACIIQSVTVDLASTDLNAESDSDVATASRHDVSYLGDAFARTGASSANSADQHSDATRDFDSRKVLLNEGIKPNDTIDAETGSDVVRRHDVDTTYLGDRSDHVEGRSAVVVDWLY
ncbi:hypothetical protein PInf_016619 [Phytophthora infestans]|nr:hypothetical protein PInf_016619 [Phytophthora infestans]